MGKEVLVKRNLAARLKPKYLKVPDMPVVVTFTADDQFLELAKSGKESFRLQQLVDAANDYLDAAEKDVIATVVKLDREIDAMWEEEAYRKIDEANDVLKATFKNIETGASKAVDKEWADMQRQYKALSSYKKIVASEVAFSLLAVAGSLAATFASHGSTAFAVVAACKSACDTATQLVNACEDVDKAGERIADTMDKLDDVVEKDLNKFADAAKGAASVISPTLRNFLASTKRADIELQSFEDKLDDADKRTDALSRKINDALGKAAKLDHDKMSKDAEKALAKVEDAIDKMLKDVQDQRKYMAEARKVAKSYRKTLDDYKEQNPKYTKSLKLTRAGKIGGEVVAAAIDVILKVVPAVA